MQSNKRRGGVLVALGVALVLGALLLVGFNLAQENLAQRSSAEAITVLEKQIPAAPDAPQESPETPADEPQAYTPPDYVLTPNMDMPVERIDGIEYVGILQLPALSLELPIASQWSYPVLRKAPARYSGSAYTQDLVICGHNYASHFGNLSTLEPGDPVAIVDMDGNVFQYQVAEQELLNAEDVEAMQEGDWALTLFTCTIGSKNRIVIRCDPA